MLPLRHLVPIAALTGVLVFAPLAGPSPYFVITPGGAYEIGPRLSLPEAQRKPMGRYAFTAVYEQEASWARVLQTQLIGRAELVPAEAVRPPGTSQDQLNQVNRQLIDESKPVAAAVALRTAGYPVTLTGDGAVVESVAPDMPAAGLLQTGDAIVDVDGQPTDTVDTLIQQVRRHAAGEVVQLEVERGRERQELSVGTRESPTEPGRPLLGVTVSTRNFRVELPFPVEVDTDDVGGPSAGLMLALGILDAVTDGDLTRGVYVAGTGTLGADGRVGPVAGTAEKALAAERNGAQLFMVPSQNFADAQRWTHGVRFVPVERFEDAVRALCSLPRPPDEAVSPAPCQ